MINAPSKDVQAILDVLRHAQKAGLPLPAAVDAYRAELRAAMRRHRASARELRGMNLTQMADRREQIVARLRRESARVRRLQRRFRSWQAGPPCS